MTLLLLALCAIIPTLPCSSLRTLRAKDACPGSPACSGHGDCERKTGVCWCEGGYGGSDCSEERPLFLEVTSVNAPELQEMLGRYHMDGIYLREHHHPFGDLGIGVLPSQVKWIKYDNSSKGWGISKFNSSCFDDTCFFSYAPLTKLPPPKGYSFGESSILHVYYKQLLFDDADFDHSAKRGYHINVSFSPDERVPDSAGLTEFNGRYVFQPRYTHIMDNRYSIMPMNLQNPNKQWVATALLGEPTKRKQTILATVKDLSTESYMPPTSGWLPEELGFQIKFTCQNHIGDLACLHLESQCSSGGSDGLWVQQCCRNTCNTCQISRRACVLPKMSNLDPDALAMLHKNRSRIGKVLLPEDVMEMLHASKVILPSEQQQRVADDAATPLGPQDVG